MRIAIDAAKIARQCEAKSMIDLLPLTRDIVCAYISHNSVPANELSAAIRAVHAALSGLAGERVEFETIGTPAVPIHSSITPDYLVCLEDGARLKTLKRYLRNRHGMTPQEYRAKWNLPSSYPMTAPSYAARRSELAKQFGLGNRAPRKTRRPLRK
jgi:predicted transcriptional regulator